VLYEYIFATDEQPEKGMSRIGVPQLIKGLTCQKHVIFYRKMENSIYILRILHSKMDYGRHLNL
jgi:plasmid stabilization system protein ParE